MKHPNNATLTKTERKEGERNGNVLGYFRLSG